MSGTEYSRPYLLRLGSDERAILAILVMREIEAVSQRADADEMRPGLRALRSLLERLSD